MTTKTTTTTKMTTLSLKKKAHQHTIKIEFDQERFREKFKLMRGKKTTKRQRKNSFYHH